MKYAFQAYCLNEFTGLELTCDEDEFVSSPNCPRENPRSALVCVRAFVRVRRACMCCACAQVCVCLCVCVCVCVCGREARLARIDIYCETIYLGAFFGPHSPLTPLCLPPSTPSASLSLSSLPCPLRAAFLSPARCFCPITRGEEVLNVLGDNPPHLRPFPPAPPTAPPLSIPFIPTLYT